MKRWLIMATVLGVLLMSAAAVWADPTEVGGNFTSFTSSTKVLGPAVYKGKGNPQGVPFQTAESVLLLAPTEVGGN
ncbi:hypothetical protein KJ567_02645 [Candidatus Bipolaricaulota bacterium]|nr:hypothetical protein [Candidatus Bipolaricaulota bacterium]